MRILSQDGMIDVPYGMVVIQRFKERIYFLNKNLTGVEELIDDMELAKYSTEEKAKKAMEMLRNAYSPKIEIKEVKEKDIPKPRTGDWVWNISEPKIKVLDNFYFQFPKDEEIEV